MALHRSLVSLAAATMLAGPGSRQMSQDVVAVGTAGNNVTLTAEQLLSGVIDRTAAGATLDVLPSVDQIMAACPELSVGDSFRFMYRQLAAFATTFTMGTGMTAQGTTAIAASFVREFLVTMVSTARASIAVGSTVNANAVLRNISQESLAKLQVGQLVTGAGIQAGSTITAVNLSAGTVTISLAATATADNVAFTFNPTATVKGLWTAAI
jgi:hypothetical protein